MHPLVDISVDMLMDGYRNDNSNFRVVEWQLCTWRGEGVGGDTCWYVQEGWGIFLGKTIFNSSIGCSAFNKKVLFYYRGTELSIKKLKNY